MHCTALGSIIGNMLFDVLPNYAHLASTEGTGPAGELMTTVMSDFDEYERRLEQLSSSLSNELSETLQEIKSSLSTLQDVLQLEESRAEEETIRMRARNAVAEQPSNTASVMSYSVGGIGGVEPLSSSRLTDFWKEKFHELHNELASMEVKRDISLAKLEDIRSSHGGSSAKTTRAIGTLNEKLMEHKQLSKFFVAAITRMNDTHRPEEHQKSIDPVPSSRRVLVEAEESSCQRILDAVSKEGESLHRLASFLTKRESALKFRVQKMQQKAQALTLGKGLDAAALDDVLYLRAEVRGLKDRVAEIDAEAKKTQPLFDVGPSMEQRSELSHMQQSHAQLQSRIREARVATIRAEHKSHDGALIVKRAVDEQRVIALRERLASVEAQKMKELQLSQEASLKAHFDATWIAHSGRE